MKENDAYNLRKKVTQYILVLKVVDQIISGTFSYAFTELFLDISWLVHKVVKGLDLTTAGQEYW